MMASKILDSLSCHIQMDCLATEGTKIFPGMRYGKQSHYHRFWIVEMKIMPLCAFPMPKQTWD
jgi:hypothetical protein